MININKDIIKVVAYKKIYNIKNEQLLTTIQNDARTLFIEFNDDKKQMSIV